MVAQSLLQFGKNLVGGFEGRIPIFARGQQIGYADVPGDLCKGSIHLSVSNPPPPEEWIVPGSYAWGSGGIQNMLNFADLPVSEWCVNNGLIPTWASKAATGAVTYKAPSGGVITVTPQADGSYALHTAGSSTIWIIAGGAALALLLLILLARR